MNTEVAIPIDQLNQVKDADGSSDSQVLRELQLQNIKYLNNPANAIPCIPPTMTRFDIEEKENNMLPTVAAAQNRLQISNAPFQHQQEEDDDDDEEDAKSTMSNFSNASDYTKKQILHQQQQQQQQRQSQKKT